MKCRKIQIFPSILRKIKTFFLSPLKYNRILQNLRIALTLMNEKKSNREQIIGYTQILKELWKYIYIYVFFYGRIKPL